MKLQLITLLCLIALTFEACKEEPITKQNDSNYFMFGTYYGMCAGAECVNIYKIEGNKLFKNNTQLKPDAANFYKGTFSELSQNQYDSVSDIEDKIPQALLDNKATTIGCPDCADAGVIYVEYSKNGQTQHWLIDTQKFKLPQELHDFVDEIFKKLEILQ